MCLRQNPIAAFTTGPIQSEPSTARPSGKGVDSPNSFDSCSPNITLTMLDPPLVLRSYNLDIFRHPSYTFAKRNHWQIFSRPPGTNLQRVDSTLQILTNLFLESRTCRGTQVVPNKGLNKIPQKPLKQKSLGASGWKIHSIQLAYFLLQIITEYFFPETQSQRLC